MITLLLDHLWQSTAVLFLAGVLTLLFRNNGAHVRHGLWLAASMKFLVPFAALTALGEYAFGFLASLLPRPAMIATLATVAQPFSGYETVVVAEQGAVWLAPVIGGWALGVVALSAFWLWRWLKLRAAVGAARDAAITASMPIKLSPHLMEPGLVGILRPVLLLPEGIAERLSLVELQAIITHENCHLRRRDNLTAALHMMVEAIFWFWPPVWWLGSRLVLERERACDEAVMASGNDPQVYATSILKVCKFYVQSPLACAAGVSGADLKQRIEEIMRNTMVVRLSMPKKALLVASGGAILALPLSLGLPNVPVALAQSGLMAPASPLSHIALDATLPAVPSLPGIARDSAPARKAAQLPAKPAAAAMDSEVVAAPQPPLSVAQLAVPPRASDAPCRLSSAGVEKTHTRAPYPEEAQRAGETGVVEMLVTIAADGHVSSTELSRSSGFARLDESALNHVRQNWLWQPPSCGKPVRTAVRVIFALAQMESPAQAGVNSPICTLVPMTQRRPPYPAVSYRNGETGTVELRVTVTAEGEPGDIVVTRSSGVTRLDDAARENIQSVWRWQSREGCSPAPTQVRIAFTIPGGKAVSTILP
jgi:TonB family protein